MTRFERLNDKSNENGDNQHVAFFGGQFKSKCRNCGVIESQGKKMKKNALSKWQAECWKSTNFL